MNAIVPVTQTAADLSASSNDSSDFVGKQLLNEVFDESLRMANEFKQALDDNIDLSLFNKYTEAFREVQQQPTANFGNFGPDPINSSPGSVNRSFKNKLDQKQPGRPRGRPPKQNQNMNDLSGGNAAVALYEQMLSQTQSSHQINMMANFASQQQIQHNIQSLLGEFTGTNGRHRNNNDSSANQTTSGDCEKELNLMVNKKQKNKEVTQNLEALMLLNQNEPARI